MKKTQTAWKEAAEILGLQYNSGWFNHSITGSMGGGRVEMNTFSKSKEKNAKNIQG